MENQDEKLYEFYQKKSDEEILKTYFVLIKKSETNKDPNQAMEIANRLKPIMKITQERNLNLAAHFKLELEAEQKKQTKTGFSNYIVYGIKVLIAGILIWAIGEGVTAAFDQKIIFRGAIFLGKLLVASGCFLLIAGLFMRVRFRKKF